MFTFFIVYDIIQVEVIHLKKRLDWIGILILICIFVTFYFITSIVLDNVKHTEEIDDDNLAIEKIDPSYENEKDVVSRLYQSVRMLQDVVNSKFKVSQDDVILINDITYKKIVNFNEVIDGIFTDNGVNKYISDLGSYFAIMDEDYYLAGNLVSYQTYYFRGDNTNIYVMDANDNEINAIIYENWTSNNKNTLATIKVVKEDNEWLIDNISILASE